MLSHRFLMYVYVLSCEVLRYPRKANFCSRGRAKNVGAISGVGISLFGSAGVVCMRATSQSMYVRLGGHYNESGPGLCETIEATCAPGDVVMWFTQKHAVGEHPAMIEVVAGRARGGLTGTANHTTATCHIEPAWAVGTHSRSLTLGKSLL